MRGLVWFRRDLRVHDQPALAAALAECDEVIPLFVFDEPLLRSGQFGSACVNFMLRCLDDLGRSLAALGMPLQWRRGEPVEEVLRMARESGVEAVYWNRDYEPAARTRDDAVRHALMQQGIAVHTFKDHVIFEAGEIASAAGQPMQRYGAYRKRWWAQWRTSAPRVLTAPLPSSQRATGIKTWRELPGAADLGYEHMTPTIPGGEREAKTRLQWFLKGALGGYAAGRNLPALDETSMLSPYFRFGALSTRSAAHAALAPFARQDQAWRAGALTWVDELIWRDFFQHILASFPHVATGPFRPRAVPPHRTDRRLYEAWSRGRTGFPLVDAGMRQLNETGWMHNRVRMVVASFLVKDLRLDWRLGERYFMERLLDADQAANNGNWQWCASTGTDAMPSYRIFNPALQAKKFDPTGDYIRRYVPELASVPTKYIHAPETLGIDEQSRYACRLGQDYPLPIVDHKEARVRYLSEKPAW
jgi:deoxyribodipyrimidine photo-lyase